MKVFDIQNWQNWWGVLILLVLPLLFVLATILFRKRKARGKKIMVIQIVRSLWIPFLALYLICSKIIGMSEETVLLKIIETIITVILVSIIYRIFDFLLLSKKNILTSEEVLPKLARDVIYLIIIIISSAFVLAHIWKLDLANMLTALGVSSIVLGLALQEPLGNLFNGISLLLATPMQKGDWVNIGGEEGKAVEISWRSIKIKTRFNEHIIISNNMVAKAKIKNLSRPSRIYAELIQFGFSYDDTPEKVKEVLFEIAVQNERILKNPPPVIYMLSYDDFSIAYGMKFYVEDLEDILVIKDEIMTKVYHAAIKNGLRIPFPKQEVELKISQL